MEWFTLALFASTLWAVAILVDKFVLTHHIKDAFSYQIFLTVTLIPAVLALFIFSSFRNSPLVYLTILVSGMILGVAFVIYNKALLVEEVSRVTPLFYLSPLFVLLFASLFLAESLSMKEYLGIGLMVFSAISVSLRRTEHKSKSKSISLSLSPALFMILLLDLILAGKDIIAKFFFSYVDFWSYLFWFILGEIVGRPLLLLLPRIRRKFVADMKSLSSRICLLCFINSSIVCMGFVLYFSAVSLTYVSLVSTMLSTQPFLVFLVATVLAVFYPDPLNERIERKGIIIKLIAVVTILIGSYLLIS
ncbi:MAG: EamA family transporter [Methanomicrobia archaeon]|nr:EamA family transporter [Methanomicrobia archaeon]